MISKTVEFEIRPGKKDKVIEAIENFRNGRIQYKKMEGEGSYFSFPTRQDVKEFKRRGNRIV